MNFSPVIGCKPVKVTGFVLVQKFETFSSKPEAEEKKKRKLKGKISLKNNL